jgi:hypothetical protein
MKTTSKLKIWGAIQLIIGLSLLIAGIYISATDDKFMPRSEFIVPGVFLTFFCIPIFVIAFQPQLAKMGANITKETLDHAGDSLQTAGKKAVDISAPVAAYGFDKMQPTFKKGADIIAGAFDKKTKDRAGQLAEAKELFDKKLIDEEEYKAMRRDILDIEE